MRSLGKMMDRTNVKNLALPSPLLKHFFQIHGGQSQLAQGREFDPKRAYIQRIVIACSNWIWRAEL